MAISYFVISSPKGKSGKEDLIEQQTLLPRDPGVEGGN
jgi:hypothetical protein